MKQRRTIQHMRSAWLSNDIFYLQAKVSLLSIAYSGIILKIIILKTLLSGSWNKTVLGGKFLKNQLVGEASIWHPTARVYQTRAREHGDFAKGESPVVTNTKR